MKILLIGCVISSEMFLNKLIQKKYDIVGVITKSESDSNADFRALAPICIENHIDFICVKNVNEAASVAFIKKKNPDVIYCFGWSQLIKKEIIEIPPYGIYGFHPAMLPNNKGRHPIIWALALGLSVTASTFFKIDESADGGEIVAQKEVPILYEDDAGTLYYKIMQTALEQIVELTENIQNGKMESIRIENKGGNVWRKRGKEDGKIDWRMSSSAIYHLVRALTHPYVGAHFIYKGGGSKEYKVWKVKECYLQGYENIEPGKVLEVKTDTDFIVKVYDHAVEVLDCDPISLKKGDYLS